MTTVAGVFTPVLGTEDEWSASSRILLKGELAINVSTAPFTLKIGNGLDTFNALPVWGSGGGGGGAGFDILEVTTLAAGSAATYTFSGTTPTRKLTLGIPQGYKGDKGDAGDRGIQGIQGIQGAKGADGAAGTKGDTGDTGAQGIQGIKGDKGDSGAQGLQGIQGIKGDKGDKGDTGAQGIQGIQGPEGPAGSGSGTGTALGAVLYMEESRWGHTVYNPANPVANDFSAIIAAAHSSGKTIVINSAYLQGVTSTKSNWNDKNLRLHFGPGGKIITAGSSAITQVISPSPEVSILGMGNMRVGTKDDRRLTAFVNVANSDLSKFKADMTWQVIAKAASSTTSDYRSGFYTSSLPGTVNHSILETGTNATGKVVMAENFAVLGISFQISGGTSIVENDTIVGASSGAKMVVTANNVDGSTRRLITRQVFGTFTNGEGLLKGSSNVGTMGTTSVVIMKNPTFVDWTKITVTKVIRKLGGSQGGYASGDYFTNLATVIENPNFATLKDGNGIGEVRGSCISLYGTVGARITGGIVENAYARCIQLNGCAETFISGLQILSLPNNATGEQAFGYGIEVVGSSSDTLIQGCRGDHLRHFVTTNPTGNSQFLTPTGDNTGTHRHGIPRNLYVKDCHTSNTWGPGFDTHHLADGVWFMNCTVSGVIAAGRKDSGISCFQNRGTNVRYINCTADGGVYGFTDATAGATVHDGNPNPNDTNAWPLTPIHSTTSYIGCSAVNFEQYGFRQGLAAESKYHTFIYSDCAWDDGGKDGSVYPTVGIGLMGVDTFISNPRPGRVTRAHFEIEQGIYWDFDFMNKGPIPTSPVPALFAFSGDYFVDFSRNVSDSTELIRVNGSSTADKFRLSLPHDVSVAEKTIIDKDGNNLSIPKAWVRLVSGNLTVAGKGSIRNMTNSRTIPVSDVASSATLKLAAVGTANWG